jgi:LysM repeat protein
MDVFNFGAGNLYLLVKTSSVPEGEARGQYEMGTCFLTHALGDNGNVVYGQMQVASSNSGPPTYPDYPAFVNMYATNFTSAAFAGAKTTASLVNVPVIAMNGLNSLGSPTVLPGQAIPPVKLQSPNTHSLTGSNGWSASALPLMGTTLSLSQQSHDLLVLGSGAMSFPGLTSSMSLVQSNVQIKVVQDPSKYVVEAGDTLQSIAKAKGFTSWVPLQMLNRLTRPYALEVGQVLEL